MSVGVLGSEAVATAHLTDLLGLQDFIKELY
jgi:hypothetical protein